MENEVLTVLTAGGLASTILEGIKFVWRKWVVKDASYDFSKKFYAVALPVLAFGLQPLMAVLMVTGYTMPSDWQEWVRQLIVVGITALVGACSYTVGIKPFKDYSVKS